jgi:hypothetical protein
VNIDQPAPEEPLSGTLVCGRQAWKGDYPWLHRAFTEIGPGAWAASDGWRTRIEDGLKTTLDFKVRPDGTAVVWCGMSGYDFHHEPAPKELFEGLAEAYRRELKRVGGRYPTSTGRWKMTPGAPTDPGQTLKSSGPAVATLARLAPPEWPNPQPPVRALRPPAEDSPTRVLGNVLLQRVAQLMLIFGAVTALTLVLSAVANAVR